jgi:integral membrane sensor domain MASE1
VAALFLWGSGLWPGITLGAFLVNLFMGAPLLVAVGMGVGNTLEALVCTALLKRHKVRPALDSLHDVLILVLLAVPIGALVSATLGVGSLWLGGVIIWSSVPVTWSTWWLGDMISLLLVTPIGADFRKKGGEERTTSLCCEKVQVSNQLSRGQNDVSTNS